jgi:SPP1 gp7 family putative phage head morphogenesis protein
MCEHCDISVYTKAKKIDPTRTAPLSREWDKDFKRRFLVIRKALKEAVIDNDVFGLAEPQMMTLAATSTPRMFAFQTSAAKVDAFMKWFQQQVSDNLLTVRQIGNAGALPWTNLYVEDSYKRGIERGRAELAKAGFNVPTMQATGGVETAVWGRVHAEKLGLLYTRTYNDLKGITNQMDTQISRVLTQAMADGDSPRTIWRKMDAVITGGGGNLGITDTLGRYIPAERRAATIARTEVIRAHHAATINEYRSWGAEGVNVQAEWSTAGFNVCEECEELQGKIFSLDEIESMIPVHPNCRCLALPYLPPEEDIAQAGAAAVEEAVPEVQAPIWPEEGISITKEAMEDRVITAWDDTAAGKALWDAKISRIYLDENVSALKTKVNVIGKTIADDIHAKLPKVEKMATNIRAVTINVTGQSNLMGNAQVFGYYSPDWGEITVGSKAMARTKYNVLKFGQGNIGLSLPQTVTHEYGHHTHLCLLDGAARNKWARFYSGKRGTGYFKKYVSVYADTNHEEAFAETFSAYIHPDYKSGMLPKELEELLESIIGRRTDL